MSMSESDSEDYSDNDVSGAEMYSPWLGSSISNYNPDNEILSPWQGSSISCSSHTVVKGIKGRLIKSRERTKELSKEEVNAACLVSFFNSVGETSQSILDEFNFHNNKTNSALADMVIRNAVNRFKITKRVAFSVFKIGWTRWKRVMSSILVISKKDTKYRNVKMVTDLDLLEFKLFIESLPKEPGYPCKHRRQKL